MSELLFIVYGRNKEIGKYLESRVSNFLNPISNTKTLRSTQTIGLTALVNKYNFTIYAVSKTIDELYQILLFKNKNMKKEFIKHISSLF